MNTDTPTQEELASFTPEQEAELYKRALVGVLAFQRDAIGFATVIYGEQTAECVHAIVEQSKLLVNSLIHSALEEQA